MKIYGAFIVAELKMFFRDRAALFWSLAFPTVMMVIFGLFDFGSFAPPSVGIVDQAKNQASTLLVSVLKGDLGGEPLFNVPEADDAEALRAAVLRGNLTAVMVIPQGFGELGFGELGASSTIDLTFDGRKAQEAEAARSILAQVLEGVFKSVANIPPEYRVENWATISPTEVAGRGQGYKGFIVPGIVSLSIMQSALFGIVFTLVRLRNQGVLKRLHATPIGPNHFLVGSLATRLLLLVIQTNVLLLVGIFVSRVDVAPGYPLFWLEVIPLIFLGGFVFASLGLAISGIAKTENTAAPLANIVSLPMMFLSGVFFSQAVLPDWLLGFAKFLPLTFLADAMRAMVNSGETLFSQGGPILGLAAWAVVCFGLAVWAFRWE